MCFQGCSSDSRVKGNVVLNIKRASGSTKNCAYPFCDEKNNLHGIPIAVRHQLMSELRFYVPPRGVSCDNHHDFDQWNKNDIIDFEALPFTVEYIEDMVDLLRLKPKYLKQASMHSSNKNIFISS